MIRQLSEPALWMLKHFEALRLISYLDFSGGVWTIGYGHTHGVVSNMRITEARAEELLVEDLAAACQCVERATSLRRPNDCQFGALVSLCFNIGDAAFRSSTVLRMHNRGDFVKASEWFHVWNKAHIDGQLVTVLGLTRRREVERTFYLS